MDPAVALTAVPSDPPICATFFGVQFPLPKGPKMEVLGHFFDDRVGGPIRALHRGGTLDHIYGPRCGIYMDPAVAYIWTPLWPLNRQKQRRRAFKTAPIYTFIGVGFADIGAFFDTIILQERFKALRQGPFKRVSTA